jgi:polyphosphate kinase 2 (PPK2 family)
MSIDLSDYEAGEAFDGKYKHALAKIQKRLSHIHYAHIVHKRRAIIAFEGWDAAGKGGIIQRLTAEWDPRYFEVWPIPAPTPEELAHHFLWRFWRRLPGPAQYRDLRPHLVRPRAGRAGRGFRQRGRVEARL